MPTMNTRTWQQHLRTGSLDKPELSRDRYSAPQQGPGRRDREAGSTCFCTVRQAKSKISSEVTFKKHREEVKEGTRRRRGKGKVRENSTSTEKECYHLTVRAAFPTLILWTLILWNIIKGFNIERTILVKRFTAIELHFS